MSRVGKKPIPLPKEVDVKINGKHISVKGPLGELSWDLPQDIDIHVEEAVLEVSRAGDNRHQRALHGLSRSLIANMVQGVSKGFTKTLILEGVGYRAQAKGNTLHLNVGFSHPIEYDVPEDVSLKVDRNQIILQGIDKQRVGQVAAIIRDFKKVEPYKGKGIRYADEKVRRKVGKVGA